jgi:DNA-binding NarL/FixJ family response regulator
VIRVLVADDHQIVRNGVQRLLGESPDARVVALAANGREVLQTLANTAVDVLVLDIGMPGIPFLELLRQLREQYPRVRIVILSAHAEDEYAVRALKGGASGYVTKERSPDDLLDAIRRAYAGGRYVSPTLAQRLASMVVEEEDRPGHAALSDREYQVLQLLGAGRSAKEIAAQLGLSVKTVSTYRARLLEKLDLKSTADLIRYAIEHRLVD